MHVIQTFPDLWLADAIHESYILLGSYRSKQANSPNLYWGCWFLSLRYYCAIFSEFMWKPTPNQCKKYECWHIQYQYTDLALNLFLPVLQVFFRCCCTVLMGHKLENIAVEHYYYLICPICFFVCFWSERSACAALGCRQKRRWPL